MTAMRTALRKMGNSVGMIVPKPLLKELGADARVAMDVRVEQGKVIATPLRHPRDGWQKKTRIRQPGARSATTGTTI